LSGILGRENHGAGSRSGEQVRVLGMRHESDRLFISVLQSRHSRDTDASVTVKNAAEALGELSE
jgi:hypothetical protein